MADKLRLEVGALNPVVGGHEGEIAARQADIAQHVIIEFAQLAARPAQGDVAMAEQRGLVAFGGNAGAGDAGVMFKLLR
ncbi:MAG: hypothetical protein U1E67_08640 [Hyphomicrobiales bacterium]